MIGRCSGGSRGGARGARSPLILGKKEMTEGKMADRASKSRPPPPSLSSRSGSATAMGTFNLETIDHS